jgi:hypothetical protein
MEINFHNIFNQLKLILINYEIKLRVKDDSNANYYLNAGYYKKRKADIYFGAVQIKKNYVSYHLMPIFVNPKLLAGISPELKSLQGKSCLNLKEVGKKIFGELSDLTKKGFEFYTTNGLF